LCIGFSNGYHLAYDCQRKLGEIGFTEGPDKFIRDKEMGPDAISAELDLKGRKATMRQYGPLLPAGDTVLQPLRRS
jgi:hypothetical protein